MTRSFFLQVLSPRKINGGTYFLTTLQVLAKLFVQRQSVEDVAKLICRTAYVWCTYVRRLP